MYDVMYLTVRHHKIGRNKLISCDKYGRYGKCQNTNMATCFFLRSRRIWIGLDVEFRDLVIQACAADTELS